VKIDRPFIELVRAKWRLLLPVFGFLLAVPFLPERFIGSALFFPGVTFLLLMLLVCALWLDSSRR
jgi:hypothetical protein